jgi:hypothetical protein
MDLILQNTDKINAVVLLLFMSIILRIVLQLVGQQWITTTAHTATLVLLPILTYVITKVISGNIALSLGMVGALSIVRFRNPVRSPLELSIYFGAITMGIAASVSLLWLIFLGGAAIFVVIVLVVINYLSKKILNKNFFTTSFAEGNSLSSLELTVSEEIGFLDNSKYLNSKNKNEEKFYYILVTENFKDLQEIEAKIKSDKRVINYQLNR